MAAVGNHSCGSTVFSQPRGSSKAGLGWGTACSTQLCIPGGATTILWCCRALAGDHLLLKATKSQGLFEGRWIAGFSLPMSTCAVCQAHLVWVILLVAGWVLQLQSE